MDTYEHLTDRAIIKISGEDRHSFLQGLITQDVDHLSPETGIFSALLTPQGKILFDFIIAESGDAFLIDCHKEAAPALIKRLTLYKLRAKVAIEIDDALNVWATEQKPASTDAIVFADPRLSGLGWRIISAKEEDAKPGTHKERRISLGVPEFGKDFSSDEMFLMDVNYDALNGVSYKKGCFIGQEVASRMKRKSVARKRTLIATYDGALIEKGTQVIAGSSTLGEILGGSDSVALALIRLDRWGKAKTSGSILTCEGHQVQLTIPEYLKHD